MLTLQVLGGEAVDRPATQRDRLAAVDGELVVLQAQYELAMSGFKFDVANALQRKIAVLESERRALAASLPPPAPVPRLLQRATDRQRRLVPRQADLHCD